KVLDRVEGASASLARMQSPPLRVVNRKVEQCEEDWQHGFEGTIEGKQLVGDLCANVVVVVAVLDVEVCLEEVDDREVGRGLAIGDRAAFEDEPAGHRLGMGEFPEETGLAHSRLADGGDDLAVADASPLQRPAKDVKLGFASHEASEAASSSGFEPAVQRTDPEEFENLHRVR